MTTVYEDKFYEKLEEYDFIWDLPSYGFYSKLVLTNSERRNSSNYCRSIPNVNHPINCNLHSICLNIENFMSKLKNESCKKLLGYNSKCCEYLMYFIYSYIKSSDSCGDLTNLYEQVNEAKNNNFKVDSSCIIENFDISKEDFEKKKDLYLHGENLYWIKKEDVFTIINKKEPFEKYLKKCYEIYTGIVQNYNCKGNNIFKSDLSIFQEKFNDARDYLLGKGIVILPNKLEAPGSIKCTSNNPRGEEADMATQAPSPYVDADRGTGQGDMVTGAEGANLGTKNIIRISTGVTGGMSLLLFSLYKFTPFRYWLRRGSLRNKISQYNAEDKNHELFLNHSGYEHSSPNEIVYNVGYSS
ncbi:PIR protein [Plasmodium vivax]|nr:PIR protein [Plasmodium vivax]